MVLLWGKNVDETKMTIGYSNWGCVADVAVTPDITSPQISNAHNLIDSFSIPTIIYIDTYINK